MEKKYPKDLFFWGFIINLIRHFYLLIPGIIFVVIGVWSETSLCIGVILLAIDIFLSLIEQIQYKNITENSDNTEFQPFQEAVMSKDWKNNLMKMLEDKINDVDPQDSLKNQDELHE